MLISGFLLKRTKGKRVFSFPTRGSAGLKLEVRVKSGKNLRISHAGIVFQSGRANVKILTHLV